MYRPYRGPTKLPLRRTTDGRGQGGLGNGTVTTAFYEESGNDEVKDESVAEISSSHDATS